MPSFSAPHLLGLFARRRRYVWIAVLAVLGHGLLPVPYAYAAAQADSAYGATEHRTACAAPEEAPADHGTHHDRAHCALCFFDDNAPVPQHARSPAIRVPPRAPVPCKAATSPAQPVRFSAPPPSRAPPLPA